MTCTLSGLCLVAGEPAELFFVGDPFELDGRYNYDPIPEYEYLRFAELALMTCSFIVCAKDKSGNIVKNIPAVPDDEQVAHAGKKRKASAKRAAKSKRRSMDNNSMFVLFR